MKQAVIDESQAADLAQTRLEALQAPGRELVLLRDRTLERPFGWVFFYSTRRFVETGDPHAAPVGNAPLIVDRRDGSVHLTGTGRPLTAHLDDYARRRQPDPPPRQ